MSEALAEISRPRGLSLSLAEVAETYNGPLIRIKDMALSYQNEKDTVRTNVLAGVNIEIQEGEFHVLLGPSGCGKSTLLNVIVGFLRNTGGEVTIHGKKNEKPGKDRGMVFQNADSAIFPWLTVEGEFGKTIRGKSFFLQYGICFTFSS